MSGIELTLAVTAAANAIAREVSNDGELALLSAVFGQLSATLATIAASRSAGSTNNSPDYIHSL